MESDGIIGTNYDGIRVLSIGTHHQPGTARVDDDGVVYVHGKKLLKDGTPSGNLFAYGRAPISALGLDELRDIAHNHRADAAIHLEQAERFAAEITRRVGR